EDIYEVFNNKEEGKFSPDLFKEFGENINGVMGDRFLKPRNDDNPYLRMSNIGRPDRQLWYDMHPDGSKEEFLPSTLIKFSYGDMIEQMILLYAKMAGHIVELEQAEVSVNGIKGHIDVMIDGVVVDVKSASTFSFKKFETGQLLEPGN